MRKVGGNFAEAVRTNGVKRVVLLSSLGAGRPGLGPVTWYGDLETAIKAVAPNVLVLHPGYFMENLLGSVGGIKADGALYQPHPADLPISLTATRDIGDVAAAALLDGAWTGHRTQEILGAADVSMGQVAETIAKAIGRPVKFVEVPPDALVQVLLGMGASADVAAKFGEMMAGFNAIRFAHGPRTGTTTTPTTVEAWVKERLAPAILAG